MKEIQTFNFCDRLEKQDGGELVFYDDHIEIVSELRKENENLLKQSEKMRRANEDATYMIDRLQNEIGALQFEFDKQKLKGES
jgi:chaperonin cofactor prefoldin